MTQNAQVLMGWKATANYVGVSVRTLQRWEQQFKFPVHRVPDGMVYGVKQEIDTWLLEQNTRNGSPSNALATEGLQGFAPCFFVNTQPVGWRCKSCGALFLGSVALTSEPEDTISKVLEQVREHKCAVSA